MTIPVSARKDATNFIASTGPDVCWTPIGDIMVPVPYLSIAFLDDSVRVSTDVEDNSLQDFHLNSRARTSQGHEPGTGKGVVIPGYLGYAAAVRSSSVIGVNGYSIVRDGDEAMINRPDPHPMEKQAPLVTYALELNGLIS
ncbi:DUF4150 domain-containing protein [Labrys sp. KNU-23]|uniref:PAAR-like domain-containing protein n=1 Tax=Labrys sp. KNU-23 TaxID=2789216 RepID=UPI0011F07C98|nr:PAAR-like domain-containing protein [Labrys sp. KNU-23]QEN90081.1 DUF4150 domain-containing protein [Labrys sp. KNU-23]